MQVNTTAVTQPVTSAGLLPALESALLDSRDPALGTSAGKRAEKFCCVGFVFFDEVMWSLFSIPVPLSFLSLTLSDSYFAILGR